MNRQRLNSPPSVNAVQLFIEECAALRNVTVERLCEDILVTGYVGGE